MENAQVKKVNEDFNFGMVVALLEENVRQLLIIKPALNLFMTFSSRFGLAALRSASFAIYFLTIDVFSLP